MRDFLLRMSLTMEKHTENQMERKMETGLDSGLNLARRFRQPPTPTSWGRSIVTKILAMFTDWVVKRGTREGEGTL